MAPASRAPGCYAACGQTWPLPPSPHHTCAKTAPRLSLDRPVSPSHRSSSCASHPHAPDADHRTAAHTRRLFCQCLPECLASVALVAFPPHSALLLRSHGLPCLPESAREAVRFLHSLTVLPVRKKT